MIGKKPPGKRPRAVSQTDSSLGHRMRLRRIELGISQDELGKKLGISFQQIQKYEKGMNRVSAARLPQIASLLEVSTSFFYDEVDPRRIEVETLLATDPIFALRLLRAYTAVKSLEVQRKFVSLIESFAEATQP